ncbi:2Fe-2S iron-sulfur cluster-binding protein [Noviherbaspirillum pedocola]|uniref:(2Fe-2S)-binding protein n=1 Tax=Noviherbaspirillum pedocola TaxID=2801341 RepID=A0A934T0K0_9BURK|nr:2Fe-2S iron-sulfur cluster-binding protein [Noviherbaspirillum pedocola]MBK4739353.1 (2Fe-2S)-binding protein [Noviherbaspirillum pedocola]
MPKITFVQPDDSRQTIEVNDGATVMLSAVSNDIRGIVAECGGSAMCATCHVYVDPEYVTRIPPVSEVENEMLASAASERRENSRLSCQLVMGNGVEELVVRIPPRQV